MLDVVVQCYKTLDKVKMTFDALLKSEPEGSLRIIAIDNATPFPKTRAYLNDLYLRGSIDKLWRFSENQGCSSGVNRGLEDTVTDPVLRMDDDVCVPAGGLSILMQIMHDIDALALLHPDAKPNGTPPREHLSETVIEGHSLWLTGGPMSGGCLMMRRRVLEEIGPFDDSRANKMLDGPGNMSKRVLEKGWLSAYTPEVCIWHDCTVENPDYALWKHLYANGTIPQ